MRADPKLLSGRNVYWIRFFLCAVYATMYVRDHARPKFHKALGINIDDYDYRVFATTNEISKQCFPIVLDIDNPAFRKLMIKLNKISIAMNEAQKRGGVWGKVKKSLLGISAAAAFMKLYMVPVKKNQIPETSRLQPVW